MLAARFMLYDRQEQTRAATNEKIAPYLQISKERNVFPNHGYLRYGLLVVVPVIIEANPYCPALISSRRFAITPLHQRQNPRVTKPPKGIHRTTSNLASSTTVHPSLSSSRNFVYRLAIPNSISTILSPTPCPQS